MQSLKDLRALAYLERDLIEERAVKFVNLRCASDVRAMIDLMADEAVYVVPGDRRQSLCVGHYIGIEAIRHFLAQCHVEYQILNLTVLDVMVDADRAAVRSRCQLRHRGTGASKPFETCDIFKFENGYIVSVHSYVDTFAMAACRTSGN